MFESVGTPLLWGGFLLLILVLLALDIGVFHRKAHVVRPREALLWSLFWVGLALVFNVFVYFRFGQERALEFLTGYLIEKALSVDNIFVFLVIFSYFSVPSEYQHRVLFWGVLGAILMRALFILAGAALLHAFHGIVVLFGAFLVFTGFRLLAHRAEEIHPERNPLLRLARRLVPVVPEYHGAKFLVAIDGRRYATPLFLVLLAVEGTDLVFALDSIPAIFAVTEDPFIVFTSNIFAVLGLRTLYFLLAGALDKLRYLKVGLGLVLAFVGCKLLVTPWVKIPIGLSLTMVCLLLGGSILASLWTPARAAAPPDAAIDASMEDGGPDTPGRPEPERHPARK
jgi:tellurite resistance protein TerC